MSPESVHRAECLDSELPPGQGMGEGASSHPSGYTPTVGMITGGRYASDRVIGPRVQRRDHRSRDAVGGTLRSGTARVVTMSAVMVHSTGGCGRRV